MRFFTRDRKDAGSRLSAFTMVEMMIVTGMLGIMMGLAAMGLGHAKKQARITKANAEVRELVNAWLSYESAYDDWPVDIEGDELEATESNLKELLGEGNADDFVYLDAPMIGGAFRDPWGTPYKFRLIHRSGENPVTDEFTMSVTFPNRHRYFR